MSVKRNLNNVIKWIHVKLSLSESLNVKCKSIGNNILHRSPCLFVANLLNVLVFGCTGMVQNNISWSVLIECIVFRNKANHRTGNGYRGTHKHATIGQMLSRKASLDSLIFI